MTNAIIQNDPYDSSDTVVRRELRSISTTGTTLMISYTTSGNCQRRLCCEASITLSRTAVYFCNSQEFHRTSPLSVVSLGLVTLRQSETGTTNFEIIIFNICLGARRRQYCRYTKSPFGITTLKKI